MNIQTAVVLLILAVIVFFAVRSSIKHVKGGCCGGGDCDVKKVKPKKLGNITSTKEMSINGMHCENCAKKVANALNSLEHVNATVNLKKKVASLKMDSEVSDEVLEQAVKKLGYTVISIR